MTFDFTAGGVLPFYWEPCDNCKDTFWVLKRLYENLAVPSSSLRPGSRAFTGENSLLVVFLMVMEPDLAHSYVLTSWTF